jgi:hypothetical protein
MRPLFQINLEGSGKAIIMLNRYVVSKENEKLLNLEMALWNGIHLYI